MPKKNVSVKKVEMEKEVGDGFAWWKPRLLMSRSEKEKLQALRKQLADLRVNSVSDLDGLIARAE